MPRPKNKTELQSLSQANYARLLSLIDSYSDEEQRSAFPEGTLNRNIRDVLGHLHHWHLLCLGWVAEAAAGHKPELPAPGYTWKTTPELNRHINSLYQDKSLIEIRQLLDDSFQNIQALIDRHSEQELFTKKYYPWTGSTSLGAYLISASSSHYDWAYKLIRKAKR